MPSWGVLSIVSPKNVRDSPSKKNMLLFRLFVCSFVRSSRWVWFRRPRFELVEKHKRSYLVSTRQERKAKD
jgi:hypothetical protein